MGRAGPYTNSNLRIRTPLGGKTILKHKATKPTLDLAFHLWLGLPNPSPNRQTSSRHTNSRHWSTLLMETSDHPSSSSPSPSIFSVPEWDWDQPMTQQQLEELDAIESAFRSQTSSSTPTSQEADDRRKIRRRLPNSIGSNRCPSAFKGRDLNSFSLSPCPTNRFLNLFHSPCQGKCFLAFVFFVWLVRNRGKWHETVQPIVEFGTEKALKISTC